MQVVPLIVHGVGRLVAQQYQIVMELSHHQYLQIQKRDLVLFLSLATLPLELQLGMDSTKNQNGLL